MKRAIDFLKLRFVMIAISLLLIAAGVAGYFVRGGLNFGIDYTAGLIQQIRVDPSAARADIADLRDALIEIEGVSLQVVGPPAAQQFTVKVTAPAEDTGFQNRMEDRLSELLGDAFGAENVEIQSSDFVGPRYSRELAGQTVSIVLVAMLLILIYTAFRFKFRYASAAVLCLIHDTLIMMGVIAVFQLEVTTTTIAAIMTIIGYSLNDTIVIFDRVRENQELMRDADLGVILNTSITQSMSRTLLTSLTTLLAVATIFIFGTGDIKNFALSLMVGVVVGTYSTIFVASPIVLGWTRAADRRRRRRDVQLYGRQATVPAAQARREAAANLASAAAAPAAAEQEKAGKEAAPESGPRAEVKVTRVQPSRKKKKKKRH
ncbi:MAG: protein translocase subunit SecF [Spirochaetaceae bacterium]|nr:MAG: protein translocase subunit SecF [Spirochaetaceae bacterium]